MRNIILFSMIVSSVIVVFVIVLMLIDWWFRLDESLSDVLNDSVREESVDRLLEEHQRVLNGLRQTNEGGSRWFGD